MQVSARTTIGPHRIVATAKISINPDWYEEGEGKYLVLDLRARIIGGKVLQGPDFQHGRSVYVCGLEPEEIAALEDALIEKYHEDLGEAAEFRDQCRIEDLRLAYA